MAVVQALDSNEVVREWLDQISDHWLIVQAEEGGSQILSPESLYSLAEQCEQAEIDDCSDLLFAQQGYLFPKSLTLWNGDLDQALQSNASTPALFINAYREDEYRVRQAKHAENRARLEEWIEDTNGFQRLKAAGSGSTSVSPDDIYRIVNRYDTQWITISTANNDNAKLHPRSLMIAWSAPDGKMGHHLFVAVDPESPDRD